MTDAAFIPFEKPNLRPCGTRMQIDVRSGKTIRYIREHTKALKRYKNGFIVKYNSDDNPRFSFENSRRWESLTDVTNKDDLIQRDPTRDQQPLGIYLSLGKHRRWEYVELLDENRAALAQCEVAVVEVPVVNAGSHLNTHRDLAKITPLTTRSQRLRKYFKQRPTKSSMHPKLVKGRKGLMIRRPRHSFRRQMSERDRVSDINRAYRQVYIVEQPLKRGVFPTFVASKDARQSRQFRKQRELLRPSSL